MSVRDWIKRSLLRLDRCSATLEKSGIVTYDDRIRWRSPRYRRPIMFDQEGHDRIGEMIDRDQPLLIVRLGSVELSCLRFYLEKRGVQKAGYPKRIRGDMSNNAGFFPVHDRSLDSFAEMCLEQLKGADAVGVWFNQYEDVICNTWCGNAELVEIGCLEPFRFTNSWSGKLAGRKVLVVHPFAESIDRQYAEKRRLLFPSPEVLPDFELKTIKAVQSIAGEAVEFATWFDAYRKMCDEMERIDFDICLIGAGAYGLPLASFAKGLGKQAIQMGGVTQILFGIKGRRWEKLYGDTTARLFNEHWVRPMQSETPAHKERVEKGCYW